MNRTIIASIAAIMLGSLSFLLPADILVSRDKQPATIQKVAVPDAAPTPVVVIPVIKVPDNLGPLDGRRFHGGVPKAPKPEGGKASD